MRTAYAGTGKMSAVFSGLIVAYNTPVELSAAPISPREQTVVPDKLVVVDNRSAQGFPLSAFEAAGSFDEGHWFYLKDAELCVRLAGPAEAGPEASCNPSDAVVAGLLRARCRRGKPPTPACNA